MASELVLTSVATDNFNRSNGALAGSNNWLATFDGTLNISSDEVIGTSGAFEGDYRSETYNANQYSQITIGSVNNSTGSVIGPTVRNNTNGDAHYAALYFCGSGDPPALNFYKRTGGGAYTLIAQHSLLETALAEGDVVTLVVEGDRLTVYINSEAFSSCSDGDITAAGAPGIIAFDPVTLDNWEGGNAATGTLAASLDTDNFNRADGFVSTGQAVWQSLDGVEITGTLAADASIVSDQLVCSTGFHAGDVRTEGFSADQWASIEIGATELAPASGGFVGLILRVQPSLNASYFYSIFGHDTTGEGNAARAPISYRIYRIDDVSGDGTSTLLAACATSNDAGNVSFDPTGTKYTAVVEGNRLSLRVNDVEVMSTTDSTYASGQPGFLLFPPSTADTFAVGNVVAGSNILGSVSFSATGHLTTTAKVKHVGAASFHATGSFHVSTDGLPSIFLPTATMLDVAPASATMQGTSSEASMEPKSLAVTLKPGSEEMDFNPNETKVVMANGE